ncbi:MAG: lysophospholipid acyltransferase family protein [Lachnospiraceae bacterium]|nr:1-acyl-sn-glycerol-3-phosphate acyltransferase [Lachnospiraceae bacterium]MEE1015168.1 lysophospholipid acyltransferase family protein [Lachnospiraceae bacterium]
MRFIIDALFLGLYLVLGIPVLLVLHLIGKVDKWKYKSDLAALRLVQWAFKVMLWVAGTKQTVIGEENVPTDQPVLYIPNHRSYFDILLIYSKVPGLTGFVAKDVMLRYPLLRDWMKKLYCLFLNRENPREGLKTILQGIENIKNGISMCIFPEGTRNKVDTEMLSFKEGSLKMAEKTGCLIIPVALTNTAEIFENHMPWIHKCKVVIEYGTPIDPKELSREEKKHLGAYCRDRIQEMLEKNKALIEA